jgi:glycerol kinase
MILALDQGTTSSRAIIFDRDSKIIASAQQEFAQIYPEKGWVEHNPNEIWNTQLAVARLAIQKAGIAPQDIQAIGITNQRETTIVWDKITGEPIYNAIVWQDRRTAPICESLKAKNLDAYVREHTGLVIDAYFSATKIAWILDNVPQAREKANKNELCFGTVDSWLVWKLTDGSKHLTDVSNASRTMLFDIRTLEWDTEMLNVLNIPATILPQVHSSSEIFGHTSPDLFGATIPIAGIAGDQQAALFGQGCTRAGMAKNTYEVHYALEGSVFIAGAAMQWLRDEIKILQNAAQSEQMALSVPDNGGVYIVPAFAGLGAPHWDMYARGAIFGLTRDSNQAHIIRAALESLAYQTADVLGAMQTDSGLSLKKLRVDGGACANNFLMQFQSDILDTPVERPHVIETTALGAAYLAGLAVGFWTKADLENTWRLERAFQPAMLPDAREHLLKFWHRAVEKTKDWLL